MQFVILELQISHLTNPRLGSEESEVASTGHTVVTGKSTIGTRQHRAIKIYVEKSAENRTDPKLVPEHRNSAS